MSRFVQPEEIREIRSGSGFPTAGQQNVELVISRQTRWLETIWLHFNVTLAGATNDTTITDKLENLVREIRVRVSDKAGSNRVHSNFSSAQWILWSRLHGLKVGRSTLNTIRSFANGTYDIYVPVHFAYPIGNEPVRNRTCLPLFGRMGGVGIDDDLRITFNFATVAEMGFSAGTVTINYARAKLLYRSMPADPAAIYVPQEWSVIRPPISGTTADGFDLPKSGLLASIMFEEFQGASPNYATRGQFLNDGATAQQYRLRFGRTVFKEFYTSEMIERNDLASGFQGMGSTPNIHGSSASGAFTAFSPALPVSDVVNRSYTPFAFMLDLLHDHPVADAMSPESMLNLYGENSGDLARLEWTGSANANARLQLGVHKFFTTQPAELVGI